MLRCGFMDRQEKAVEVCGEKHIPALLLLLEKNQYQLVYLLFDAYLKTSSSYS